MRKEVKRGAVLRTIKLSVEAEQKPAISSREVRKMAIKVFQLHIDDVTGEVVGIKDQNGKGGSSQSGPTKPHKSKGDLVVTEGSTCVWYKKSDGTWWQVCS